MKNILIKFVELFHPIDNTGEAPDDEREHALDVVKRHGLRAYYYMPAAGLVRGELRDALQLLAARGYFLTNEDGNLYGQVAEARPPQPSSEEVAKSWRSTFRLVDTNRKA